MRGSRAEPAARPSCGILAPTVAVAATTDPVRSWLTATSGARRSRRRGRTALGLLVGLTLAPCSVGAHDPSAWGGLFRTRDAGATWLALSSGSFVSGAVALTVSPVDPTQLLLATDSGVLSSRNAGRDWTVEAAVLVGAAFAVVYDWDGARALASGAQAIFRRDGEGWRAIRAPAGAAPARALTRGAVPGRVYLAGWTGLHRSDDWGTSWVDVSAGLPDDVEALEVRLQGPEVVHAIAGGRLWQSDDAGRQWRLSPVGSPSERVEAVTLDGDALARVWALAGGRLWRSDDGGAGWRAVGGPLPDPRPVARAMAVVGPAVLVATERGLYQSRDGGDRWDEARGGLPAHLEAGPLVRDPASSTTIYAGFALTPYAELWRRAAEGRGALSRLGPGNLAGAAAFLALLMIAAVAAVRWLRAPRMARVRTRSPASPTSATHNAP